MSEWLRRMVQTCLVAAVICDLFGLVDRATITHSMAAFLVALKFFEWGES